jgi:hypothetical protein
LWKQPVPPEWTTLSFAGSANSLSGRAVSVPAAEPQVPWMTAEELCAQARFEPTGLMVDIEGSERVWATHRPCFPSTLRTIILELHPRLIELHDTGRILRQIMQEGFQLEAMEDNVVAFERP